MNLILNLNRLPQIFGKCLTRRCSQTSTTNNRLVIEPLTEREIIRVKGDEVVPFLQGLITNDIKHLHPTSHKAIYAMFLNKSGRVLYDTILYSTSEPTTFLIECDKNVTNELKRHLRLYRVRRSIDIDSMNQEFKVWQSFIVDPKQGDNILNELHTEGMNDLTVSTDPRLKHLGIRLLAGGDKSFLDLTKLFKQQAESAANYNFRLLRYNLGVAEGVIDLPPGKCFPLEANCDLLNGVSFHKGCYIGQELTARVHHTGVIRKRHMPVKLTEPLLSNVTATVQNEDGANCGTIIGSTADRALGLLRVENVLKAKKLIVNGNNCFVEKPQWWP